MLVAALSVRSQCSVRAPSHSEQDSACVLCLTSDQTERKVAAVTSERLLGLYDRTTLQDVCSFGSAAAPTHADRINELCFSPADILYSASSDGTVRAWDAGAANAGPSIELSTGGNEVWSVDVDGGWLLAAGTETAVMVWDVRRTATPVVQYEVHTESVTAVRFHPTSSGSHLLTGSMDGLVCEIDCNVLEEDDAVVGIHNTESPVTAIGFYGSADAKSVGRKKHLAWALSSIDTVTLWDLNAAEQLQHYDDLVAHRSADHLDEATAAVRGRPSSGTTGVTLDYVTGCQWDEWSGRLLMMGGLCNGSAYTFALQDDHRLQLVHTLAPASGTLAPSSKGHADRIRCFHYGRHSLITGAEDGRICASSWESADGDAAEATQATEPVGGAGPSSKKAKRPKDKDKLRAKPY